MAENVGACIYCGEDTGMGTPGCAHVCCRKLAEGVPLADVILDAAGATFTPGGPGSYEEMVRMACARAERNARSKAFEEAAKLCDDEADTWEQYGLTEKVIEAEACASRIRASAKEAPRG